MSTSSYIPNTYTQYIVAYSFERNGRTVTYKRVSIEKDPFDALLESYRSLMVTHKPGFQMRIVKKITYNPKKG